MLINCFSVKKSVEEAEKEARRKSFLARIFLRKRQDEIVMKTIFIENRLMTFDIIRKPSVADKIFRKGSSERGSKIQMIGNGSTCGVAYYDSRGVEAVELDVPEESVQYSDFSDKDFTLRGNVLVRKILRRRVGGSVSLEISDIKSIYRPYHIAFFGQPEEGAKVFYIPIAADDCMVKRTF